MESARKHELMLKLKELQKSFPEVLLLDSPWMCAICKNKNKTNNTKCLSCDTHGSRFSTSEKSFAIIIKD